jgi:uncharacterized protein
VKNIEIAFPFRIDGRGLIANAAYDAHVRQMIEQVLFTTPGERVNRPDFGCRLAGLVFSSANSGGASAAQAMIQAALQRWLGDVIKVESVVVDAEEAVLTVTVQYVIIQTQERRTATFAY